MVIDVIALEWEILLFDLHFAVSAVALWVCSNMHSTYYIVMIA